MRGDGPVTGECMVKVYHILSRLERLGEHRKLPQRGLGASGEEPQPQTLFGRFVRNSVRFYVCFRTFSAIWKLAVRNNNNKSTRNCE